MRIVSVDPADPRDDRIGIAVDALAAGGVVALPTETFYALAADSLSQSAVARLNTVKGKPADSPILLLAATTEQARAVALDLPPSFSMLAERFWPGPLTLLVAAAPHLPAAVTSGLGTVALRVPGLALPRRVASALGRPISGVSANRWGEPPGRTAADVARNVGAGIELILDGGPTAGGSPSTILDLTASPLRILRHGAVPASALRPFLPDLAP